MAMCELQLNDSGRLAQNRQFQIDTPRGLDRKKHDGIVDFSFSSGPSITASETAILVNEMPKVFAESPPICRIKDTKLSWIKLI